MIDPLISTLIFLLIPFILVFYYQLKHTHQNFLLFSFSLFLIFLCGWKNLMLLYGSIFFCFFALDLGIIKLPHLKKKIIYAYVFLQVSFLFYIKIQNINIGLSLSYLSLMLIGLSLDSIWGRSQFRLNSALVTALSFFPILPMGPIENISAFKRQFENKRAFKIDNIVNGIFYLLLGLFKILCISNPLQKYTAHQEALGMNIFGFWFIPYCLLSFFKLYSEFSGFIDLVRSTSLVFGIQVTQNFDKPYLAESPQEIWQRWHISLTNWIRAYIYFPILIKSKNIYIAFLVTMIAVASWHGGGEEYTYWCIYWILVLFGTVKIRTLIKKFNIVSPRWVNRLVMLLLMAFSTICFMAAQSTWSDLLIRLTKLNDLSAQKFIDSNMLGDFHTLIGIFNLLLLLIFENFIFEKKYKLILLPIFIILLSAFAQFRGTFFFYLGL